MIRTITPAAISTIVANGIAVAVAFGLSISPAEQTAILAFVGSVTSLVFAIYAAVHVAHVKTAAALVTSSASSSSAPPSGTGTGS